MGFVRLPVYDFALAERDQIAAVPATRAVNVIPRERETPGLQLLQVQPEEHWSVNAIEAERGQQLRLAAEQRQGAALHAGPGADAGLAKNEDGAGDERDAGKIAGVAADGDEAAAHGAADFVAGFAVHEDDAAAHAVPAAAVGRADQVARVAVDMN